MSQGITQSQYGTGHHMQIDLRRKTGRNMSVSDMLRYLQWIKQTEEIEVIDYWI